MISSMSKGEMITEARKKKKSKQEEGRDTVNGDWSEEIKKGFSREMRGEVTELALRCSFSSLR